MIAQQSKPFKGKGMEGFIARWYARTRGNDMRDFRQQAGQIAGRLQSGASVLEVAPGPGFFSIELATAGNFQITGLDISRTFVQIATENAGNAGANIDFRLGNAYVKESGRSWFDGWMTSLAFRWMLIPRAYASDDFRAMARQSRFGDCRIEFGPIGFEANFTKPALVGARD